MMKILFFILLLIIGGLAVYFPINTDGYVTIEWLDYHVEISSILLASVIVIIFFILFIFTNFLIFIKNIPSSIKKNYLHKKEQSNTSFIIQAFESLYTEDLDLIKKLAKKIESSRNNQINEDYKYTLTLLLAQYNEILFKEDKDNETRLEDLYQELLNYKTSNIIALKGLIKLRMDRKRYHDALFYAEKAFKIDSKIDWLINDLIVIYTELENYEQAEKIIKKAESLNFYKKEEIDNLLIKNYVSHATHCIASSEVNKAIILLEKALKIDPAYNEAVYTLARLYSQDDNKKLAQKIIERAWKKSPSMSLGRFLLDTYPNNKRTQKSKLLENLVDLAKEDKAGYLLLAEFYLEQDMIVESRLIMDKLLSLHAADSYMSKLMALIEAKSQNNYPVIINWIHKI